MLRRSCRLWCAAAASSVAAPPPPPPPSRAAANSGVPPLSAVYGRSFTVGARAWEQIRVKNAEEGYGAGGRHLRLAIDSGGCHGYLYKFAFETPDTVNPAEDLVVTEAAAARVLAAQGTDAAASSTSSSATTSPAAAAAAEGEGEESPAVVVDKFSIAKLEGAVLDYHSELKGSAFVVVGNELVDQSCACAMSFSIKRKKGAGKQRPGPSAGAAAGGGAASANNTTGGGNSSGGAAASATATQIRRQRASKG